MCSNCGSNVGPFYRAWKEKGEIVTTTPPLCKNTKEDQNRISKCVERRNKIDTDRYMELRHAYE